MALTSEIRDLCLVPRENRMSETIAHLGPERVRELRGSSRKVVTDSEAMLAACDRRALHAVAEIQAGEVLTAQNIQILRGERNLRPGLHPRFWEVLEGAKATRAINYGDGIVWDDVLGRES